MTIIDRAKHHLEQTGIHGMSEAKGIIRELLGEIDRITAELERYALVDFEQRAKINDLEQELAEARRLTSAVIDNIRELLVGHQMYEIADVSEDYARAHVTFHGAMQKLFSQLHQYDKGEFSALKQGVDVEGRVEKFAMYSEGLEQFQGKRVIATVRLKEER